jgi:hypothetical protein
MLYASGCARLPQAWIKPAPGDHPESELMRCRELPCWLRPRQRSWRNLHILQRRIAGDRRRPDTLYTSTVPRSSASVGAGVADVPRACRFETVGSSRAALLAAPKAAVVAQSGRRQDRERPWPAEHFDGDQAATEGPARRRPASLRVRDGGLVASCLVGCARGSVGAQPARRERPRTPCRAERLDDAQLVCWRPASLRVRDGGLVASCLVGCAQGSVGGAVEASPRDGGGRGLLNASRVATSVPSVESSGAAHACRFETVSPSRLAGTEDRAGMEAGACMGAT